MDVLPAILSQFGLYGLLTTGIAIVFAASRVVNPAHCDFAMIGAYAAATLTVVPFGWRVVVVLLATVPLLVVIELVLRRSMRDGLGAMLVTLGVGMALRQIAEVSFGATPRSVAAPIGGSVAVLGTQRGTGGSWSWSRDTSCSTARSPPAPGGAVTNCSFCVERTFHGPLRLRGGPRRGRPPPRAEPRRGRRHLPGADRPPRR